MQAGVVLLCKVAPAGAVRVAAEAALDFRSAAEGVLHRPAQGFRPVQDEQVGLVRRRPALYQVVQQCLHDRGVLSRALVKAEDVLASSASIPAASTVIMSLVRCSPSISVATRTRPRQVRRHPLAEGLPRQRLAAPRNAGLGEVGPRILRNAVARKTGRPLALQVETFLQSVRCRNLGLSTRRHLASPRNVDALRGKRDGLPGLVGGGCCLCGEDRKAPMNRVASSLD